MMKRKHHGLKPQQERRGVAAVEAAVVMPVLLLLVLGTIELGTALRASTIMQSSVREAGRLVNTDWRAIVQDGDDPNSKVERDLRNFVTASGLPGQELAVTMTYATGNSAGQTVDLTAPDIELELIKIELVLPYEHISLFPNRYMGGANITTSLVMRVGIGGGISG